MGEDMIDKEIVAKGGNLEMCSDKMKCTFFDIGMGCIPTLMNKPAPCEKIQNRFIDPVLKPHQSGRIEKIKNYAKELAWLIENACPENQEKLTAQLKLQEVVMWVNASIVNTE